MSDRFENAGMVHVIVAIVAAVCLPVIALNARLAVPPSGDDQVNVVVPDDVAPPVPDDPAGGAMWMEVKPRVERGDAERFQVTAYTNERSNGDGWCEPCNADKKANGNGDHRIALKWDKGQPPDGVPMDAWPIYVWKDSSGSLRYYVGRMTLDQLWSSIQQTVRKARLHRRGRHGGEVTASRKVGYNLGEMHGAETVQAAINFVREKVGEGKEISFEWRRNGRQDIPISRSHPFSWKEYLGDMGSFRFSATGTALGVDEAQLGYEVDGDDLILSSQGVRLKGFLSSGRVEAGVGSQKVGFLSIGSMFTILSVIKSIHALLNPHASIVLGGRVKATALLTGEELGIVFEQPPHIHLVMLFERFLGVDSVSVTPSLVRAKLSGFFLLRELTLRVV